MDKIPQCSKPYYIIYIKNKIINNKLSWNKKENKKLLNTICAGIEGECDTSRGIVCKIADPATNTKACL